MKSRTIEIIDNHIKALEEELEWYQEKNAEMNEKIEDYKNEIAEMNRVPPARVYAELIDNNKKLVEENARLRDQLRWRNAKKEPPNKSGYYFTKQLGGIINTTYYNYTSTYGWEGDNKVLKWIPIPEGGDE